MAAAATTSSIAVTVAAPAATAATAAAATASTAPAAAAASAEPFDRYYFGYGSNMSSKTLNRRNMHPVSSVPAVLSGYRLAMNLKSSVAPLEPSFANVEKDAKSEVHGVLHRVTASNIAQLEREEGGGKSYQRFELDVKPYVGDTVQASVFVVPDSRPEAKTVGGDVPCSARYKSLLVNGAKEYNINADYIKKLEAMPTSPLPQLSAVLTEERKKQIAAREIDDATLRDKSKQLLTAVKGVVIDLSDNKTFAATVYGGQDKTLDMAKFLCDSECPIPTSLEQLNVRHKEFINAALAGLIINNPIAGHMKGQVFDW